jgi:hypothetical protein
MSKIAFTKLNPNAGRCPALRYGAPDGALHNFRRDCAWKTRKFRLVRIQKFCINCIKTRMGTALSLQFPFRRDDSHDRQGRHATVIMTGSSLVSSCRPVTRYSRRNVYTDYFLVFLLHLFIAFQFYETHFETRKHEPLRKDDPVKDSHHLSRNNNHLHLADVGSHVPLSYQPPG